MERHLEPVLFSPPPPEVLICPICVCVLTEPHLMSCCGAHICEACIAKFQSTERPSPCCRTKFGSYKTLLDKGVRSKIENLEVQCTNKEKKCQWRGKCKELASHLREECSFELIDCTNQCGGLFPRKLLVNHQENECLMRPSKEKKQSETEESLTTKGNSEVKENKSKEGENNDAVGDIVRKEFDNLKISLVQEIVNKVESGLCQQMEAKINSQREDLKAEISSCKKRTELLLKSNQDEVEKIKKEISVGGTKSDHSTVTELKWIDSKWPIPVFPSPTLLSIPPCVFTMTEFKHYKERKQEWFSPPFYSGADGYKFVVGISPSGSGTGRDTHISLTTYLAKGEHDDQLKWPFYGTVKISLLNWREQKGHKDGTVCFDGRAQADHLSNRVQGKDRASKGKGYPQFVAHKELCFNSSTHTEYLRNDTLCLSINEVQVDSK